MKNNTDTNSLFPILIANNNDIFLISKRKILIIENIDNFEENIVKKESSALSTLKKYGFLLEKYSFKPFKENKNTIELRDSNEHLLIYCLSDNKLSTQERKFIYSSFSQTNPEYNYILKLAKERENRIYLNSNMLINNTGDSFLKKLPDNKKENIPNLFELSASKENKNGKEFQRRKNNLFCQTGPVCSYKKMRSFIKINYKLNSFSCSYRIPNINHCYMHSRYNANGYDSNKNYALLKSIAEAHERFSSGYIDKKYIYMIDTRKIISQDITYNYLGISKEKFINNNYICKAPKTKKYPVLKGKILNNNKYWWAPIDMIKFPYFPEKQERFCYANSSGVAAGRNFADACIRAIFEYLERHFIVKHWLLSMPFIPIKKSSLPSSIKKQINDLETNSGGKIIIASSSCKSIPHIIAMYIGKNSNGPAFHLSSSAHFKKEEAATKALNELANSIIFCPIFRKKIHLSPMDVTNAEGHYSFYHDPKNFKLINTENLIASEYTSWQDIPDIQKSYPDNIALKFLLKLSYKELGEITAFDITAPETAEYGLSVIKVIAEKGLPIWFGNTDLPLEKDIIKNSKGNLRKIFREIHPMG